MHIIQTNSDLKKEIKKLDHMCVCIIFLKKNKKYKMKERNHTT
jgi:hypothetical protein